MATSPDDPRYRHDDLLSFAMAAFVAVGLEPGRARIVADRMLDADLHGHYTHGIALLPRYLREMTNGVTALSGDIEVVSDKGAAVLWDAQMLPGHWVMQCAVELAVARARDNGAATIAIRRSQHIGALQAYLPIATRAGCMISIWVTDTQARSVAPFGGLDAVLTSEPMAFGIPTSGDPILVDISTSLTSNAAVKRALAKGERLPSKVLLDGYGEPTDDPAVLGAEPRGTILPLGGMEHGYKGFGLALAVSALSLALPGWGRTKGDKTQGIVIQVLDPDAFGGREAFVEETDWMVNASHASRVRPGDPPVRMPGERALALAASQRRDGVRVSSEVAAAIAPWADQLAVPFPAAI